MKTSGKDQVVFLGLMLAGLSVAPGPETKPAKPSAVAEARHKASLEQFEEVWIYYQQSRTDSFMTYYWSKIVLESQQDLCTTKDERIAALVEHQKRMRKLQNLVHKVRKLGFSRSVDVKSTNYYMLEVESWLEQAKAKAE